MRGVLREPQTCTKIPVGTYIVEAMGVRCIHSEARCSTFRKEGEAEYSSANAKVIEDHRQVLAQIITTPNAIGYSWETRTREFFDRKAA